MARSGGNQSSSRKAWLVVMVIAVIAVALWFMMSTQRGSSSSGEESANQNRQNHSHSGADHPGGSFIESPGRTTVRKRPSDSSLSEVGEDGPQFPLVDEVLADDEISNEAAAVRLREIVDNKGLTLLEREEALAHGLNLDFVQFVDLVADHQLPQPLAQRFFDEMRNYNEHRDLQVRSCISLVDHVDETLKDEAAEQLAFYIGLEEWADKPEILKLEGYKFLEELAKRVPAEPEPVNPDADIPETAPINPLESDEDNEDESSKEGNDK